MREGRARTEPRESLVDEEVLTGRLRRKTRRMVAIKSREERAGMLHEEENGSIWNLLWASEQRTVVRTIMNI